MKTQKRSYVVGDLINGELIRFPDLETAETVYNGHVAVGCQVEIASLLETCEETEEEKLQPLINEAVERVQNFFYVAGVTEGSDEVDLLIGGDAKIAGV